jgi:LemA protein
MGVALLFLLVIILVGVAAIMFVIGAYNALVTLGNRYKNAYAQIDVQLKRRYDLIPNIVETAKGYLQYERGTLEAVVAARNAAATANARAAQNPGDAAATKGISSAESAFSGGVNNRCRRIECPNFSFFVQLKLPAAGF